MNVPVLARETKSWPHHADAPMVQTMDLVEALDAQFSDDAHFCAYEAPIPPRRLAKPALERQAVRMVAAVFDVDDPEPADSGEARDKWRTEQRARVDELLALRPGAVTYDTRGGYRVIYELAEVVELRSRADAERWKVMHESWCADLAAYGITADPACKDWTRLYRLPRVTRDGKLEDRPVYWPSVEGAWPFSRASFDAINVAPQTLTAMEGEHAFPSATPALMERARKWLRAHGPAVEGQGGDKHTFVACAKIVRGFALSDAEAVMVLAEWDRGNVPPWGDELRTKMDNAWSYGEGEFGDARKEFEFESRMLELMGQHVPTQTQASKALESLNALLSPASDAQTLRKVDAPVDSYAAQLDLAANAVMQHLGATTGIENERPFFEACDLFASDGVTPWLVGKLIRQGGIAVIATEPKSAKTWAGTEIAVAIATGTPAFGKFKTTLGRVAYFYTEDLRKPVGNRVRSLCASRGIDPQTVLSRFHAQPRGRSIDVTKQEDCARLIASCNMLGKIDLLVLDPLRNIHTGKENEADAMSEVFARIRMLSVLLDCTVLVVHHSQKLSETSKQRRPGQRMRGSGAIHGFVDSGMYMEDLRVDPTSTIFTNTVISEVKGARGAGTFELTLKIKDDVNDEAINARWSVGEPGEGKTTTDETPETLLETARACVDAMVLADIKHQPLRTVAAIAKACPLSHRTATITVALKLAVQNRWLSQDRTGTYVLRPEGKALAAARHATTPVDMPEPPDSSAVSGYARSQE